MNSKRRSPVYRFSAFEFDGDTHELRRETVLVSLRPQPASVLALLLANAGRVVTREELRDEVWGESVNVDYERSLNSCIRQIRRALGERADHPTFIQTFPRRGYRFDHEVEEVHPADGAAPTTDTAASGAAHSAPGHSGRGARPVTRALVPAVVLLALIAAYFYWTLPPTPSGGDSQVAARHVLAVLPFRSLSDDPDDRYFGEGLSEEMVSQLGRLESDRLVVLASIQALREASIDRPSIEVARDLGADLLLSGTVRRAGGAVRVTSQLVSVADGAQIWAGSYDGSLPDVLGIQHEITRQIVGAVSTELAVPAVAREDVPLSPAYHAYLRGLALYKRGTPTHIRASLPLFEEAVELEPEMGEAWAALALAQMESPLTVEDKARSVPAAAYRALGIDPHLPSAHLALGQLHLYQDWDLVTASEDFERAVQYGPGLAKPHMALSTALTALGQHDRAVEEARRGKALDPLSPAARADTAAILYLARRYDEAIAEARLALDLEPNMVRARHTLLHAAVASGQEQVARDAARARLVEIEADAELLARFDAAPYEEAMVAFWQRYAEWAEAELGALAPTVTVPAYVAMGDTERAIEQLVRGAADRASFIIVYVGVVPFLDDLRADPRVQALLAQVRHE